MDEPLILVDSLPRKLDTICDASTRRRLTALGRLEISEDRPMPDVLVDRLLPDAAALLIGQTAMPRARLEPGLPGTWHLGVEPDGGLRAGGGRDGIRHGTASRLRSKPVTLT